MSCTVDVVDAVDAVDAVDGFADFFCETCGKLSCFGRGALRERKLVRGRMGMEFLPFRKSSHSFVRLANTIGEENHEMKYDVNNHEMHKTFDDFGPEGEKDVSSIL